MNIGIMTFHGARNYGAVLQAYALQQFLLSIGLKCQIIDFVSKPLKDYTGLYPQRNGWKSKIKNLLMLKYHWQRTARDTKFEDFINEFLILTNEYFTDENELCDLRDEVDVYVVGSDQVWNTTKVETGTAYFLGFASEKSRKIAYAVSLGGAEAEDLERYRNLIEKFSFISCRERRGAGILSKLTGRNIKTVLDPTLLVENEVWEKMVSQRSPLYSDYIFYYSLDGFDKRKNNVGELQELGRRFGKKVVVLTPEWPKSEFVNVIDAGPMDFLNLVRNAHIVCTNSFHGTVFSIVFRKNFYVLDRYDGRDDRKIDILQLLHLEHRMIKGVDEVKKMKCIDIDYESIGKIIDGLRQESGQYLKSAINI